MKPKGTNDHLRYIVNLSRKGGPQPHEYQQLSDWFRNTMNLARQGRVTRKEIHQTWDRCGEAFSPQTIQGMVARKPHGYAGDFEIIDKIHTRWVSPEPHLRRWDLYLHATAAPKAVCNRKAYFQQVLNELEKGHAGQPRVLNVGSGPARDLQEFFCRTPGSQIIFDCVDLDARAIAYAKGLLGIFEKRVNWHCRNIFRFQTDQKYDLIWSAGLFDYLNDKHFVFLLKRLFAMTTPQARVVVGNFSQNNPSRPDMEFAEWVLHHRSQEALQALALQSGAPQEKIRVVSEPLGVNLFLIVER